MKNCKFKVFAMILALTAIVAVFTTSISAADPVNNVNFGGYNNVVGNLTTQIPNYEKTMAQDVFSACLSFAYFKNYEDSAINIGNTSKALFMKSQSAGYVLASNTGSSYNRYFLAITSYLPNPDSDATQNVYVYFAYTVGKSANGVKIDAIPEDWGAKGATFNIVSDTAIAGIEVYQLYFDSDEQMYFRLATPRSTFNYTTPAVVQSMALQQYEQVVYAQAKIAQGWNETFAYGYRVAPYVDPPKGAYKWIDAYNGYVNGIPTGGGFTQEDIDSAYDDGYMDGEQIGYHQGAQDGYANGYAHGYDEGYSFSAGAEEIESAYEDGKADGLVEGYQNGKADGVTEGYTNGYTAGYDIGYDNGLETGYEDGKADGLVEGYQNGKADGVTEGYTNGYTAGYDTGYETGYDEGYDYGYNLGESVGSTKIDIGEIISAVPEGAKSIINGALGFEIFGINVAGTLTALLVVAIVAFVVKKLMTR